MTRTTAAACLGTMCRVMSEEELMLLLNIHLLGKSISKHIRRFVYECTTYFLLAYPVA